MRQFLWPSVLLGLWSVGISANYNQSAAAEPSLEVLRKAFHQYTGAELVFQRGDLPEGRYHDVLKPLDEIAKAKAAAVCVQEAKMYPPGYFRQVGLKKVGVFAACVSKTTSDRSRPYDSQLGGYRYFGVYNGSDAIAAAFYSEGQLGLTFHHEIFHHVDSTVDGVTEAWHLSSDDAFYRGAISGLRPYSAAPIAGHDLEALRNHCIGRTLQDAVSEYAAKNAREDQAETARHMMSMLPNSLVQVVEQPDLAGSQRILHVLREYERSIPDGPGMDWFVDVALQRACRNHDFVTAHELLARLKAFAEPGNVDAGIARDPRDARAVLRAAVQLDRQAVSAQQALEIVRLSTTITELLLHQRIKPDRAQLRFDIAGKEDVDGVNHTLRHDVVQFANDAKRLKLITSIHSTQPNVAVDGATLAQLRNLRLLSRYFVYIDTNWTVTPGTKQVFELAKKRFLESLPPSAVGIADQLRGAKLPELAEQIPKSGRMEVLARPRT